MGVDDLEVTTQFIADGIVPDLWAINLSFETVVAVAGVYDGNNNYTQFVDWSASTHDVLYAVGMPNTGTAAGFGSPSDNYNGITVAPSAKVNGVGAFRQLSVLADLAKDADGDRTSIDILAPGENIEVADVGGPIPPTVNQGSSFATPHVVGTVALLQEHRVNKAGNPRFGVNAPHHEVMKAVIMNSADKLIDNGTVMVNGSPVPQGGLLGMTRTVLDRNGDTWLESEAYDDSVLGFGTFTPLDDQMGVGHLNASRALTQYQPGEYDPDKPGVDNPDVPLIGWDFDTTDTNAGINPVNKYRFDEQLAAGSFVSITLAWDRVVEFMNDGGTQGVFDPGDTFEDYVDDFINPPDDSVINDLDIYLLPRNAINTGQAVAQSTATVGTIEHLFFQIPATGQYEFWIEQFDDDVGPTQDYGVAWWAVGVGDMPEQAGDFDGSGTVDAGDYTVWKNAFGTSVTPGTGADGNSDGVVNIADYTVWRDNLGAAASASVSAQPVPAPSGWAIGWLLFGNWFVPRHSRIGRA